MSPAEQPGADKSNSSSDPLESVSPGDVEKTLNDLESMTTTLVQEVGSPPPEPEAAPSHAEPAAVPATEAVAAVPPAESADAASEAAAPAETAEAAPVASEPTPVDVASPSEPAAVEPAAAAAGESSTEAAQAEVDREINQALTQLKGGSAPAGGAVAAKASETPPAPRRSIVGRVLHMLDSLLAPLALVAIVLDLPVRWLPGFVRQLLGYVAVGTALMAGALWVYLLVFRSH